MDKPRRKLNKPILAAVCAAAIGAATVFFGGKSESAQKYIAPSDPAVVARGKTLYANNCASCHGLRLEGQPNWRDRLPNGRLPAPPHDVTGHTWHHPDDVLVDIIKHGLVAGRTAPDGYQSDMPAYANVLADSDIVAVLAYIKSNWPENALAAQKEITLQQK